MNRPGAPLFATVNVTGACNLDCPYCFFHPRPAGVMAQADFERVVDELAAARVFFINVSGGEPFTHPLIDGLLRHAHERFAHVVILTNGAAFRPEHFDTIREIARRKGGFPIQVSLDSDRAEINRLTRGEAGRVVENIARLVECGADVVVAMVITRHNAATLTDSIRSLSRFTRHFHLMPFQPVLARGGEDRGLAIDAAAWPALWAELRRLREELELHFEIPTDEEGDPGCAEGAPCMAAFTHLVIDPDLRVRPCDRLVGEVMGDLGRQSLAEVWSSAAALNVISRALPLCEPHLRRAAAGAAGLPGGCA